MKETGKEGNFGKPSNFLTELLFAIPLFLIMWAGLSFFSAKPEPEKFSQQVATFYKFFPSNSFIEYARWVYFNALSQQGIEQLKALFIAKKLFVLGVLWGIFEKLWLFFVVSALGVSLLFLYRKVGYLEDLCIKYKARRLSPFRDKSVYTAISILLKNPAPASILHHESVEGGLLRHSLAVAHESARLCKERGLNPKKGFLAGLLHDFGKLLIYRKSKETGVPAPSPIGYKPVARKGEVYKSLGVNQKNANKIALYKLSKEYGVQVPAEEEIWDVVSIADRKVTSQELQEKTLDIGQEYLLDTLQELIGEVGKSLWRSGSYIFVLAERFNEVLSELLLRDEPSLSISTKPDMKGVHVIAYSVVKSFPLIKEYEGKRADKLGLFNIKVGADNYNGVYILQLPLDIPESYEEIKVYERGSKD